MPALTIEEARIRRDRGVALMDEKEPGWRANFVAARKASPGPFSIRHCQQCTLGFAMKGFYAGCKKLGLYNGFDMGSKPVEVRPGHYGFELMIGDNGIADWKALEAAWLEWFDANLPGWNTKE